MSGPPAMVTRFECPECRRLYFLSGQAVDCARKDKAERERSDLADRLNGIMGELWFIETRAQADRFKAEMDELILKHLHLCRSVDEVPAS